MFQDVTDEDLVKALPSVSQSLEAVAYCSVADRRFVKRLGDYKTLFLCDPKCALIFKQ